MADEGTVEFGLVGMSPKPETRGACLKIRGVYFIFIVQVRLLALSSLKERKAERMTSGESEGMKSPSLIVEPL